MSVTPQNTSTPASNQNVDTSKGNEDVKSIADALAALPKENEQTMKGFLEQQMANTKNMNDTLVEQFGSAIDNSEIAASVNEVKEAFRNSGRRDYTINENNNQQEYLTNIQTDLDRILEIQGDILRSDVIKDDVVNDTSLNDVEDKSEEKNDDDSDIVKEDIKPNEVKVEVQVPSLDNDDVSSESETAVTNNEDNLLGNIANGQSEQNSILNDISEKLSEPNDNDDVSSENENTVTSNEDNLLGDIVKAQEEQNSILNDISEKLSEPNDNDDVSSENETVVTNNEDTLLGDIVKVQEEQNLSKNTEGGLEKIYNNLVNIHDSLDDILEQYGDSVANTDVNEPDIIYSSSANELYSQPSMELSENSLHDISDTMKMAEVDLLESLKNQKVTFDDDTTSSQRESITEMVTDVYGSSNSINTQDDSSLNLYEDENVSVNEMEMIDRDIDKSSRYNEDITQDSDMVEHASVLDTRMEMAAREERDITPILNEVQMFNRMSLTKEEIQVLASEIGKSVAEHLIDRDGEKARDAAYLDEVERIIRS